MKRRFNTLEELEAYENQGREAWIDLREALIKELHLREIVEFLDRLLNRFLNRK